MQDSVGNHYLLAGGDGIPIVFYELRDFAAGSVLETVKLDKIALASSPSFSSRSRIDSPGSQPENC